MRAVTASVRLFDCFREKFISGQELMAIQGFDLSMMKIPGESYRLLNVMAGGGCGVFAVATCINVSAGRAVLRLFSMPRKEMQ